MKTTRGTLWSLIAVLFGAMLLLAACGDSGDGDSSDSASGGGTKVDVELKEWSVTPTPDSASAGTVDFTARNTGTIEHEMVIVRTDLAPDALPTIDSGNRVDENSDEFEVIGEIAEFEAGSTESAGFDLEPGNYVLFCNIEGHYKAGMNTGFTVSG
ncbi:MAG TPA: hypothetical protein ENI86_11210 [Acidimicrobiales bacterium]|nr:hypothetical protein [Acidimicrobiales bacterium]